MTDDRGEGTFPTGPSLPHEPHGASEPVVAQALLAAEFIDELTLDTSATGTRVHVSHRMARSTELAPRVGRRHQAGDERVVVRTAGPGRVVVRRAVDDVGGEVLRLHLMEETRGGTHPVQVDLTGHPPRERRRPHAARAPRALARPGHPSGRPGAHRSGRARDRRAPGMTRGRSPGVVRRGGRRVSVGPWT